MITRDELVQLEIERRSILEVVRQFTIHDCDPRMEVGLDEFLTSLETKAADLKRIIEQNI